MDLEKVDVEIKWPFKLFLGGGSGVGKTTFCFNFIKDLKKFCDVSPTHIFLLYNEYQTLYDKIKNINDFKFIPIRGIPLDLEEKIINLGENANPLVIVDDQFLSKNLEIISEFYLVKSRHLSPPSSFMFLSQSLFGGGGNKGKIISLISSNSTHITIFRTSRAREAYTLFEQILQKNSKVLKSIFDKITQEKFTYLFIDCTSYSDLKYRFKSHLFEKYIRVYIMDGEKFSTMFLISPSQKIQLENYQNNFREKSDPQEKGSLKFSLENSNGICDDGLNVRIKPILQRKNYNLSSDTRGGGIRNDQGGYFSENNPDDPITPPVQNGMNDTTEERSEHFSPGVINIAPPEQNIHKDKSNSDISTSTDEIFTDDKSTNTIQSRTSENYTNTPVPMNLVSKYTNTERQPHSNTNTHSQNSNNVQSEREEERIKKNEDDVNKFIPDQNNSHKSLIKVKNILPITHTQTLPSHLKKKRVLPQWIRDVKPKKKKRVLPDWILNSKKNIEEKNIENSLSNSEKNDFLKLSLKKNSDTVNRKKSLGSRNVSKGGVKRKLSSRVSVPFTSGPDLDSDYDLFSPDNINPVKKNRKKSGVVKRKLSPDSSSEYELFSPGYINPNRKLRRKPKIDYRIYA